MKISHRQLSIIIFYMLVAFKVLSLPSLIYQTCKNDGYLAVFLMMLIDVILLWASIKIIKQAKDKNIYEFIKQYTGGCIAKIFLILLILIPVIHLGIKAKGLEWFLIKNLYTEFKWFQFAIPVALIICYMIYKGATNIGRVCEFFVWIIIAGVAVIVIKSLNSVDTTFFMPFLSKGIKPLIKAIYNHLAWFGLSGELLLFAGSVDFSKEKKSSIVFYSVVALFLVQFVIWCFYGAYGVMASTHNFAISDISQISNAHIALDELSWLIVSVWAVAQVLHLAIYGYLFCKGIKVLFNIKNNVLAPFILFVGFISWVFWGEHTIALEKIFLNKFVVWVMIIAQYLIPIIIFALSFIKKETKLKASNEKADNLKIKDSQEKLKNSKAKNLDKKSRRKYAKV